MSVYVDDGKYQYKRGNRTLVMSHMIADTHEQLMDMATRLRLDYKWLQQPGTQQEHYDVAQSKRAEAITEGAKPITVRELVLMLANRDMEVYQRPPAHWPDIATR